MRISELTIFSSDFEDEINFLRKTMGFQPLSILEDEAVFQVGFSTLRVVRKKETSPYHIAFHIPEVLIDQAVSWLQDKVRVEKFSGKEIVEFPEWKARSVYFKDPAGNILEFIARKEFTADLHEFDPSQIAGIAEIGAAVDDIEEAFKQLNRIQTENIYDGDFDTFCAVGDDEGLFIIINKYRKSWFPAGDRAYSSDFSADIGKIVHFKNGSFIMPD